MFHPQFISPDPRKVGGFLTKVIKADVDAHDTHPAPSPLFHTEAEAQKHLDTNFEAFVLSEFDRLSPESESSLKGAGLLDYAKFVVETAHALTK